LLHHDPIFYPAINVFQVLLNADPIARTARSGVRAIDQHVRAAPRSGDGPARCAG